MEPDERARVGELLSGVALHHLETVLSERPDAAVTVLSAELRASWMSRRGSREVLGVAGGADVEVSLGDHIVDRDLSRFQAAVDLALGGGSVEFRGGAIPRGGSEIVVRAVLWPSLDHSAVVALLTVEDGEAGATNGSLATSDATSDLTPSEG